VQYQATLVLTAWGDDLGFRKLEHFVDSRLHDRACLEPHRLHGYDNVYDLLADAVDLMRLNRSDRERDRERVFGKLLALYGPCWFEGRYRRRARDSRDS
jgi:hypothetical protein